MKKIIAVVLATLIMLLCVAPTVFAGGETPPAQAQPISETTVAAAQVAAETTPQTPIAEQTPQASETQTLTGEAAQPPTTPTNETQDAASETPQSSAENEEPLVSDMLSDTSINNILDDVPKANTARIELPEFDVPCRNAILVSSDTGEVLYEKDPDEPVPVASITKIMTLLLTLEAVEAGKVSLEDYVPISHHAYSMGGSQIWLEPGEQFTLDELVKAICVSSANDAAVAVAEFVGGSEPAFAELMNNRAAELGMENTHFVNACGLDAEGHLSTARDVAIMSEALLHHPLILEYSGIWTDSLRNGETQLVNTNKLLNVYDGITGLKTGTTSKAGVCISATATREGTSLIAVVLGSNSGAERIEAATSLLDYGFATYEFVPFPQLLGAPATIGVTSGEEREAEVIYGTPEGVLVRKGEAKDLNATFTLPQSAPAPVAEGQELGEVTLTLGELELAKYSIFAQEEIEKMNFVGALSLLAKALISL